MSAIKPENKIMSKRYLTFKLDNETFAFEVEKVNGIDRKKEVTPVPKTSSSIAGVLNLRGKIILAVHLRECFGLAKKEETKETCFVFIETSKSLIAFIVDSVCEVIDISTAQIETTPALGNETIQKIISGLAKVNETVISILNPEELVLLLDSKDRLVVNQMARDIDAVGSIEVNSSEKILKAS